MKTKIKLAMVIGALSMFVAGSAVADNAWSTCASAVVGSGAAGCAGDPGGITITISQPIGQLTTATKMDLFWAGSAQHLVKSTKGHQIQCTLTSALLWSHISCNDITSHTPNIIYGNGLGVGIGGISGVSKFSKA